MGGARGSGKPDLEPRSSRKCMRQLVRLVGLLLVASVSISATIFSSVIGLIHDPQHRPVEGARVTIHARDSDWGESTTSNSAGEFSLSNVPLGSYTIAVEAAGFAPQTQELALSSGAQARLHFPLSVAETNQSVEVRDTLEGINPDSSTPTTIINRGQIAETPGASRTNSIAMITDYVPGAYVVHDQLHIRGGHQVSWLLDGVPVPNTSIASNVGPQFDPKDVDYLEVQRGGYTSDYGDRTFGVFNVIPRTGFERNNEMDILATYGS